MMKRILLIAMGLSLLVAAYIAGYLKATFDDGNAAMHHWEQLAELDKSFLKNVVASPNKLASGSHVLEIHYPGLPPRFDYLDLTFTNGRLTQPDSAEPHRAGMGETFQVEGNVVSWHYEGIMYEANTEFIGIIDGNMAWGRVYGWNPGNESIGNWRLYPKPAQK
jgi:hypothetical protein